MITGLCIELSSYNNLCKYTKKKSILYIKQSSKVYTYQLKKRLYLQDVENHNTNQLISFFKVS